MLNNELNLILSFQTTKWQKEITILFFLKKVKTFSMQRRNKVILSENSEKNIP